MEKETLSSSLNDDNDDDNGNEELKEHSKFCREQNLQRINYPKAGEELVEKFSRNHDKRVENKTTTTTATTERHFAEHVSVTF